MVTPLQSNIPVYDPNGSTKDLFANFCDSYLSLNPTYATVEGYDFHGHEVVVLKKGHWDFSHIFKSTIKILSYITVVMPLIAYVFSNAYRSEHKYHVKNDSDDALARVPTPTTTDKEETKTPTQQKRKKTKIQKKAPSSTKSQDEVTAGSTTGLAESARGAAPRVSPTPSDTSSTSSEEDDDIVLVIPEHVIKDTDTREVAVRKADAAVAKTSKKTPNLMEQPSHINLIRKGYLHHTVLTDVVRLFIKKSKSKEEYPHFVTARTDVEHLNQKRYQTIRTKSIDEAFKQEAQNGHPKKGAMALSVHLVNHYNGVFIDFDTKTIVCYEPFGEADDRNLSFKTLVPNIKKNYFDKGDKVTVRYIQREHQKDGYNCGRYVINFFIEMLKADSIDAGIKALEDHDISKDEIRYRSIEWGRTYQRSHSDY
ncbi:MAG: hypothetical protein S4CHLAM37_03170 [Chlamydiia bacterium]|nr:hypothetical protein [Chlamydiia bacterium]